MKSAILYFVVAGLAFIFSIIEYNKVIALENGTQVLLTYTSKWLYQNGGKNAVLLGHLSISLICLLIGAFGVRASKKSN